MKDNRITKVLSVDWDYFVLADDDTRMTKFPNGHQYLDSEILANEWAKCYSNNKALEKCSIDTHSLEQVNQAISSGTLRHGTVGVNHDSILDFLPRDRMLDICNIDHHHDAWPCLRGQRPNCENWVSFLHDQGRLNSYMWISKTQKVEDEPAVPLQRTAIEVLKKAQFDLLFICLSPLWSPPHLDRHFFTALPIPRRFRTLVGNRWAAVRQKLTLPTPPTIPGG